MHSRFHIVFPGGDRTKLSVVEIDNDISYEINDYAVASRLDFESYDAARTYAIPLAIKNNIVFVPDKAKHNYLD